MLVVRFTGYMLIFWLIIFCLYIPAFFNVYSSLMLFFGIGFIICPTPDQIFEMVKHKIN